MRRAIALILALIVSNVALPSSALADSNFRYDDAVETAGILFDWNIWQQTTTVRNGKKVQEQHISFANACFGEGSITDREITDTRVYWTISIVNPKKEPAHMEMLVGFNADSPLFSQGNQAINMSVKGDTLSFTHQNLRDPVVLDAFDIDTTTGYGLTKPTEKAGYNLWTVVINDELATLLRSSDAFPLECILTDRDVSIPMILTSKGAEDYQKIVNIYDVASGNGLGDDSSFVTVGENEAAIQAVTEEHRQKLLAIAEEQPEYISIFPKAALDYYFAALKARDAEAFVQCTQFSPALSAAMTEAEELSRTQGKDDTRVFALEYLRKAVLKCFGKEVKSARNDKPETYFNSICVTPYPKGYKKYSIAILYAGDVGFEEEVARDFVAAETFNNVDIKALAVVTITNGKDETDYYVYLIDGNWYVSDSTVAIAYILLSTDSWSVSLLNEMLSN